MGIIMTIKVDDEDAVVHVITAMMEVDGDLIDFRRKVDE